MKKQQISLYVPSDCISSARKQAEEEKRSLSSMISILLAESLERRKNKAA